jgi:hypothetical protein
MPFIATAITGALTAFTGTAVGTFLTTTFTGRLLASVAISALQVALAPKPSDPGITTKNRAYGGTNPLAFPLGRIATAGDENCPPMTHGKNNAYLTMVIELSDVAGVSLIRVAIDGAWAAFDPNPASAHADYGMPFTGKYAGYAWIKYYDGSQTAADPMLLAKYGSYPARPWTADMALRGVAYAILTFRFNRDVLPGEPQLRFELNSIPLYDPRKDSTVGGSGTHRWGNIATWEPSLNPQVIIYNILRGITIASLGLWGGGVAAEDLPLTSWFTAMNECDVAITTQAGVVPQYRAGFEVRVNMAPADVIDELNKACAGQIAEVGGVFKPRVGGPGLPVLFITDDDIIINQPQDLQPFAEADSRANGIDAKYPNPDEVWIAVSAPSIYDAAYEAEDGARRVAALDLPACPYPAQVQRLMQAMLKDNRRARKHGLYLPPDAMVLEPLDSISWTSTRNGYVNKLFEVSQVAKAPRTLVVQVSLREADPADYSWSPASEIVVNAASGVAVTPAVQTVTGFDVFPYEHLDQTSAARRAGLRIIWDGTEADAMRGIEYEIYVNAGALVKRGTITDVASGELIVSDGLIPGVLYAVRLRPLADWPGTWTAFDGAIAPAVRLSTADLQVSGHQSGALNADPAMVDLAAWTWSGAAPSILAEADNPAGGTTAFQVSGSALNIITNRERFEIDPARNYFAEMWGRQLSGTSTARMFIAFQDAAGNNLNTGAAGWPSVGSVYQWGVNGVTLPGGWTRYTIAFGPDEGPKIPPGAKTAQIGIFANLSGGAGVQRFASARVLQQLQRTALDPLSLQDNYLTFQPTRFTRSATAAGTVLATLNLGAIPEGKSLRRGIHFEVRRPGTVGAAFTADTPRVELQTRRRQLGSAWSAWTMQNFWREDALYDLGTGIGPWQIVSAGGNLNEPFDEFEYRLIVINNSNHGNTTTDWIGNIWMWVSAFTKGP